MYQWKVDPDKEKSPFPDNAMNHEFFWLKDQFLYIKNSTWGKWFPIGINYFTDEELQSLREFLAGDYMKYYHDPGLDREDIAMDLKNALKDKICEKNLNRFCEFVEKADFTNTLRYGKQV